MLAIIKRLKVPSVETIQSEGDLEVVLLHETHSVLAEIIGPELYSVGGTAPEQSVLFHTRSTFNLFLILLVEIFAEGQRSAYINQKYENWSLFALEGWHKKMRTTVLKYVEEAIYHYEEIDSDCEKCLAMLLRFPFFDPNNWLKKEDELKPLYIKGPGIPTWLLNRYKETVYSHIYGFYNAAITMCRLQFLFYHEFSPVAQYFCCLLRQQSILSQGGKGWNLYTLFSFS
jgi:hypothetical protein